jgi:NAD-dependent deacetylase
MYNIFEGFSNLKVVAVSKWLRDRAKLSPILMDKDFHVVGNGIDTKNVFQPLVFEKLKEKYNLSIFTQNIDDLHERSGNTDIIHLHGKLRESRSVIDNKIYSIKGSELNIGDYCEQGGQLRPNVVWFGEAVPNMDLAIDIVIQASIFIIIGTSLNVFPAASLIDYATKAKRIIIIDPNSSNYNGIEIINEKATKAVPQLVNELLELAD